jgi:hypothetical protein
MPEKELVRWWVLVVLVTGTLAISGVVYVGACFHLNYVGLKYAKRIARYQPKAPPPPQIRTEDLRFYPRASTNRQMTFDDNVHSIIVQARVDVDVLQYMGRDAKWGVNYLLCNSRAEIRIMGVFVIYDISEHIPQYADMLIHILKSDPAGEVRKQVIRLFPDGLFPQRWPDLLSALNDPYIPVRRYVMERMGLAKTKAVAPYILEQVRQEEDGVTVGVAFGTLSEGLEYVEAMPLAIDVLEKNPSVEAREGTRFFIYYFTDNEKLRWAHRWTDADRKVLCDALRKWWDDNHEEIIANPHGYTHEFVMPDIPRPPAYDRAVPAQHAPHDGESDSKQP